MKKFLSCDWGTSSFRLRLIDTPTQKVIAEENDSQGIAETYGLWQLSGNDGSNRWQYYSEVIHRHILLLVQKTGDPLDDVPLVISGMASSSIGMMELPYKEAPFLTDGSDLEIKIIERAENLNRKTMIISGVKTADDIMRGEETKLVGCISKSSGKDQLFILPGTHPKHVRIEGDTVTGFTTYMTGEYFDLLSKKSILSASVEEGGDFNDATNKQSFEKGVTDSIHANLLHSSFLVRTNTLFQKYTRQENYFYLSGLLIGCELKEVSSGTASGITLLADDKLNAIYAVALKTMNIPLAGIENADDALIRGQMNICSDFL